MTTLELNPYEGVDWTAVDRHTAQLHSHTSHPPTDGHGGTDPPDVVIDDYHGAGYAVLALTGHEYNVTEPTWPWTDWDRDPNALGMVAVEGVELGDRDGGEGIDHDVLGLWCDLADTTGASVDDALAEVGSRDGLAVFAHPGRYERDRSWYVDHLRAHPHVLGLEVVNATDRYPDDRDRWDAVQERLAPERPVWGFANDDFHGRDAGYAFDRSRNVLLLDEVSEPTVRNALVGGRFYFQHAVEGAPIDDPPTVAAVRHDPDRGELALEADGYDAVRWLSGEGVVGRGPRLRYREVEPGFVRARLETDAGSWTGTQPFLLE